MGVLDTVKKAFSNDDEDEKPKKKSDKDFDAERLRSGEYLEVRDSTTGQLAVIPRGDADDKSWQKLIDKSKKAGTYNAHQYKLDDGRMYNETARRDRRLAPDNSKESLEGGDDKTTYGEYLEVDFGGKPAKVLRGNMDDMAWDSMVQKANKSGKLLGVRTSRKADIGEMIAGYNQEQGAKKIFDASGSARRAEVEARDGEKAVAGEIGKGSPLQRFVQAAIHSGVVQATPAEKQKILEMPEEGIQGDPNSTWGEGELVASAAPVGKKSGKKKQAVIEMAEEEVKGDPKSKWGEVDLESLPAAERGKLMSEKSQSGGMGDTSPSFSETAKNALQTATEGFKGLQNAMTGGLSGAAERMGQGLFLREGDNTGANALGQDISRGLQGVGNAIMPNVVPPPTQPAGPAGPGAGLPAPPPPDAGLAPPAPPPGPVPPASAGAGSRVGGEISMSASGKRPGAAGPLPEDEFAKQLDAAVAMQKKGMAAEADVAKSRAREESMAREEQTGMMLEERARSMKRRQELDTAMSGQIQSFQKVLEEMKNPAKVDPDRWNREHGSFLKGLASAYYPHIAAKWAAAAANDIEAQKANISAQQDSLKFRAQGHMNVYNMLRQQGMDDFEATKLGQAMILDMGKVKLEEIGARYGGEKAQAELGRKMGDLDMESAKLKQTAQEHRMRLELERQKAQSDMYLNAMRAKAIQHKMSNSGGVDPKEVRIWSQRVPPEARHINDTYQQVQKDVQSLGGWGATGNGLGIGEGALPTWDKRKLRVRKNINELFRNFLVSGAGKTMTPKEEELVRSVVNSADGSTRAMVIQEGLEIIRRHNNSSVRKALAGSDPRVADQILNSPTGLNSNYDPFAASSASEESIEGEEPLEE